MKNTKKILAVVLSVMLLISVMPFAAFAGAPGASDTGNPGSGVDINPVAPVIVLPTVTATDITAEGYDTAYEYTYANDGDAKFANYYGDITVSFDRAIEADDVVLAGSYDNFQSGAWTQVALRDLAAGEEFRIVKDGLVGSAVTFSKLIAITGGDFRCAAKGTDVSGVTMTVKFNLYETKTSTEAIEIATKTFTFPVVNYVAEANGVKYESFDEALRAISTVNAKGQFLANGTLRLLADCAGNGYSIASGSNLIIDFNGKTYTVDAEPLAGSTGTKTQAFQLLKDSTVIFKNGTLTSTVAKMLVQNYSDLTLEGMTLTLDNPNYYPSYTLSNNNGDTMIIDSTINANPAGGFAFDVCRYASYPSVSVTVTGDSEINGDVEIFASKGDPKEGLSLNLNGGTMTGDIVVDSTVAAIIENENVEVKKAAAFTKEAPEGYEWVEAADGKSATLVKIPEPPTATVTQLPLAQITNVATTDGKIITFDKGYKFVAQDDAESVQDSAYKTYSADYVITSDTALPAGSVTLGGQYNDNDPAWVTLTNAEAIPANTEVRLLQSLLGEAVYTYEDICTLVREFNCAVKTNDASVAGADITVELRIYETEYDAETGTYTEKEGAEPIAIDDVVYELETPKVAQIGEVRYETLEAAFAAAQDGNTITLLDDCAGNGIKVLQGKFNNQGLTVDFAGHTYTVDGTTVGSTGTETQGFQLLKDNNITFKDGKIYGDSNATTSLMFLIQNYSNLTLDNMELELIGRYYNQYTLSNNNGDIVINDSVINAPDYSWAGLEPSDAGSFAFDVCRYSSYPSVSVTVTGNSVINGDIQMDAGNGDAKQGMKLNLVSGTMNGDIVLTEGAEAAIAAAPEKAEAKKAATFAVDAPEGYIWNSEGVLVELDPENGQSVTLDDGIESNIYLDADAYGVDEDEAIVKVTYNKNSDLNSTVVQLGTDTYALKDMTKYVDPQSPWNGNYIIAQSQAPAQMHEDILVELYANDEATAPVASITTSAAALCENVIATSNDAEYVALCKSLLDYGRSAQILFDYDLDTLADSYYNDAVQTMTASDMTKTIQAVNSGVSFKGVSMTVLSTTKWNIITNTAETVSGITGGSDNASAESGILADGNNAIIVSGINAADFANAFTVETNSGYVTLSAAMIARAIVKTSSNNNYKDLARAFYVYGCAAEAFFA